MNIQNKLYKTQFCHHPKTDLQSVAEQRSRNAKLADFASFIKLLKPKLPESFKHPDKRALKLLETRKKFLPLSQPPFIS